MHIYLLVSGMLDHAPYGEEKYTKSLASWLANHEYEVTAIGRGGLLHTKSRHSFKQCIQNTDKQNFKHNMQRANSYRYLAYSFRIFISLLFIVNVIKTNRKYPIDILHAQDTGYAGLAAVISGKLLNIPVILSAHGNRHKNLELTMPKILKKIGFYRLEYHLDIFNIHHADRIIAVNPDVKAYFERITGRTIDFFPIPINVVDFIFSESHRKMMREELGIEENATVVGFIGRLSSEKNINTLLYSFADVSKSIRDLKLIIVGEGRMKNQLERIVLENDIDDRVVFCGLRYDIAKILCGLDIFVLPSYSEGLSTSLLESMACERAIICSDIPANRQLVQHNKEALLVDPNNKEEFTQAILLLCENQHLRRKLGHYAKIKSNSFDKEVIFPSLEKYYENIKNK
jgi:glycosyltransferase involved in cell wall biosynthesis